MAEDSHPALRRAAARAIALSCLALPMWALGQAAPAGGAAARDAHAAQCVAALDTNTQDLARQVKTGLEAARPLLSDRLLAGAAFVGDTYLHGDSSEAQAKALSEQAQAAQKSLPAAQLAARQAACADEGARLYASGNGVQQALLKRLAKKRMDKLLGQ